MSSKCLVTNYKGVVDNPELLKLGECRVALASGAKVFFGTSDSVTLTIVSGSGVFSDMGSQIEVISDTQIVLPVLTTEASTAYFEISGGNAVVSVDSKYNVNKIKMTAGAGSIINIEDFSYSSLDWLSASNIGSIYGNVSLLPETMFYFQVAGSAGVVGKTKDIPIVNINLRIQNTGIVGTMETYAEKLFHAGAERTNLSCYFGGGSILLDGRTWSSGYECLITVTSSYATITMGSYVNKTYNGTTWVDNS
jgi:hypothetical protein